MRMTGTLSPAALAAATVSTVFFRLIPCAIARTLAAWMVAPSACGSENGTPTSMMSAPPSCRASRAGIVASSDG